MKAILAIAFGWRRREPGQTGHTRCDQNLLPNILLMFVNPITLFLKKIVDNQKVVVYRLSHNDMLGGGPCRGLCMFRRSCDSRRGSGAVGRCVRAVAGDKAHV